jgi:hypothetical protein
MQGEAPAHLQSVEPRLAPQAGEAAEQVGESAVSGFDAFYAGAHVHSLGDSVAGGIPHRQQSFAWSSWQT